MHYVVTVSECAGKFTMTVARTVEKFRDYQRFYRVWSGPVMETACREITTTRCPTGALFVFDQNEVLE